MCTYVCPKVGPTIFVCMWLTIRIIRSDPALSQLTIYTFVCGYEFLNISSFRIIRKLLDSLTNYYSFYLIRTYINFNSLIKILVKSITLLTDLPRHLYSRPSIIIFSSTDNKSTAANSVIISLGRCWPCNNLAQWFQELLRAVPRKLTWNDRLIAWEKSI